MPTRTVLGSLAMSSRTRSLALLAGAASSLLMLGATGAPPSTPGGSPRGGDRQKTDLQIKELNRFTSVDLNLPTGIPERFEVTLPIDGANRTLVAIHRSLRSESFQVFAADERGLTPVNMPPARTYRGTVAELEGSGTALSLIDGKLIGLVDLGDGQLWYVQPASDFAEGQPASRHVIYAAKDVNIPAAVCGNDFFDLAKPDWMEAGEFGGGGVAGAQPNIAEIGFDADFEFFQKNGSNLNSTVNDIESVMNGVEFIYDRDVNITYEFTTFVVRTTSADPYTTADIGDLLCEFRTTWNTLPESGIQRDVAQLYTGKTILGSTIGLAWLGVLCNQTGNDCGASGNLAYSVVESRYTTTMAFRQSLSAHELGHNWGAVHCDGDGDCHIMCSSNGGCDGIAGANFKFGVGEVADIIAFKNSVACDQVGPLPLEAPFLDEFPNTTIDSTKWTFVNGAATSTAATNEPTATRSLNLDSTGSNEFDDDEVRSNVIQLGGLSNMQVKYWTQHKGVENGETLTVFYWSATGDWIVLNTITSDGVDEANFTQHTHAVPANGLHDGFRLRFVANGNDTGDDWYIDDVSVSTAVVTPPANDECTNAAVLATGSTNFDTTNATNSPNALPSNCNEGGGTTIVKDVWYLFIAPCTGNVTISACNAATFDSKIAVYASTCPTGGSAVIACSDNSSGCGTTSAVTFSAAQNAVFYVRVGGATAGGTGTLSVTCTPVVVPPSNDECTNALVLPVGATNFDTTNATNSPNALPSNCNEGGGTTIVKDVWYLFLAPCTGNVTVSTCGGAGFDTKLAAYASACPTAGSAVVACSDNAAGCGTTSSMTFAATQNAVYYIRVGGASAGGTGTLNVSCTPIVVPPANDECVNATLLGEGTVAFNSTNATNSPGSLPAGCDEGSGVTVAKDIWYLVVAPCTGTLTLSTCNAASFDTRLAVYAGSCPIGSAPVVACDDNSAGCSNGSSTVSFSATQGSVFYVRLGGATTGGTGNLTLTCVAPPSPCVGDLNGDDVVDGSDLAVLLGSWGSAGGDLDGNGTTDGADLAALLGAWGGCP